MFLIESLETLLGAEDKEILKALHYVKKPPVKRISYIDILHPSGIPPQPEVEVIDPSDLGSKKELFLGLDLVSSLYDINSPDEVKEKAEKVMESLRKREDIRPEDHPKTHIALALPEKEHLELVKGKWRDYVWKPVTYDGKDAPNFDGWVRDLLAIADALKAEGLKVTFYGGRSAEILEKSGYDIVNVELRGELPKLGYPRDPSVAWSHLPVIMNMTLDHRRGEEDVASQFFRKIGLNPSFRPRWFFDGRYLIRARAEGGNFIVIRGKSGPALFTGIGIRGSNRATIELMREYFSLKGIELDIYGVPLPGYIRDWRTGAVHLDVVMMNTGPCVILSPGRIGFYSFLRFKKAGMDFVEAGIVFKELGVEVDEIPAKGSEITLVNALNLGRGKLVVDSYNEEASKYLEREWGLDLIRVHIPQIEAGGGGVRCASREYYPYE